MQNRQKTSIAVVIPRNIHGGVETIKSKLLRGLLVEGFDVKTFFLDGRNIPTVFASDLRLVKELAKHETVIYMGSIAYASHIFLRNRKLLFVHGLFAREQFNGVMKG